MFSYGPSLAAEQNQGDQLEPTNIKQVLGVTPRKAAAIQPPTTHHENYPS